MSIEQFCLRLNKVERDTLQKISASNGMTATDYIKYRLFHNNPEVTTEGYIYETPTKDKHNYLNMAVINNIYWMLYYFILTQKKDEEMQELKDASKEATKQSLTNYGYLEITKDE